MELPYISIVYPGDPTIHRGSSFQVTLPAPLTNGRKRPAFIAKTRQDFINARGETNPEEYAKSVQFAREVADVLRKNFIQGKLQDDGIYRMCVSGCSINICWVVDVNFLVFRFADNEGHRAGLK